VSSKPASRTVNHRNSAWAEQAATLGGQSSKKVVVVHHPITIRLLTTGSRRYVQVFTDHMLGSYSEDKFKTLFSQEASNAYFLLQYH